MKTVLSRSFLTALTLTWITPAWSATDFVADLVTYDSNSEYIYVEGNVEIKNDQGYFYLEHLAYDIETGRIDVQGQVRGVLSSGEILSADYAYLDPNSRVLVLENARLYLESNLQITAKTLRDNDDETYGENITASTCRICAMGDTPIWQVEASQVIRDKNAQKIYFNDAVFRILGIPIGYTPALRIPAPEAKRMSGFLSPKLIFSDLYLSGVRIPYYHVFNNHSDFTATAYLTTKDIRHIEGEYRHKDKGLSLNVDGAFSIDDGTGENGRYFLYPTVSAEIYPGFHLNAGYHLSSDYDFAPDFTYSNPNENYINLKHSQNSRNLLVEFVSYRPRSEAQKELALAFVSPHVHFEQITPLGDATMLTTSFDIDYLKREDVLDYRRISFAAEIDHQFQNTGIFEINASAGVRAQIYDIDEYTNGIHGRAQRTTPFAAIDASLPFSKDDAISSDLFTPRAQFIFSESYISGVEIPNTDALFVEHDYASLFSTNRYSGTDRLEQGARLNIGATYSRAFHQGAFFESGFGRVIRFGDQTDLTYLENLTENGGEWVGYTNYTTPDGLGLFLRGALDSDFQINRAEVGASLINDAHSIELDLVHLAPEIELGFENPRTELNANSSILLAKHWLLETDLSYDIENKQAFETALELTYGNECIELALGYSKDFNRGAGIDPETKLQLTVTFIGLGDTPKREWATRSCVKY